MKIKINKIMVICLILCTVMFLMACGSGDDKNENGTGTGMVNYSIEVKTEGGMPLSKVKVCVYEDNTLTDIAWVQKTDDSGKISFEAKESSKYAVVLEDVPEGFNIDEYYDLKDKNMELVLKAELKPLEDLATTTFKRGDVIKDFSVTTTDGTVCTVSELLKEKKAVVLNFWYLTCEPCRMEFPYLQEAYEQYSSDVAVIAMNPLTDDDKAVADYKKELSITFDMATCSQEWESAFKLAAYPTTIVIDRYGVISFIHSGMFFETETFAGIFEYYTSDEYKQTIVKDVKDIIGDGQ